MHNLHHDSTKIRLKVDFQTWTFVVDLWRCFISIICSVVMEIGSDGQSSVYWGVTDALTVHVARLERVEEKFAEDKRQR